MLNIHSNIINPGLKERLVAVTRTDGNKNNDNANIIAFDDIFNEKNLMTFVFQTIEELEVRPTSFDEFEVLIKSRYELYELKYSAFGENVNYEVAIEKLFKGHSTMSVIQAKMQ